MSELILLATGERLVGKGIRAFNPAVEELLRNAGREIQIATYRVDQSALPLLDLLEEASRRGVRVQMVVNAVDEQPRDVGRRLKTLGRRPRVQVVDFRSATGGFLHAKAIVVDRQWAILGSANLTWGGLISNHEIGVLIQGPEAWEVARLLDVLAGLLP